MSPLLTTNIRMSNETKEKGNMQASKLGLNLSEYIRLIIELDSATNLIEKLKK
jgi:predicted DNA-binding protein